MARHPYTRRVVLLVLLLAATVTVADFVLKREVAAAIAPGELGAFFASFYAAVNVLALVLQLFAVRWLLERIGAHRSLMVLPLAMLGGGVWLGVAGGLGAALLAKGADGSLRHSLHGTALEVLFVPLSPRLRADTKTAADVMGHRGGQALGSLVVLGVLLAAPHEGWLPWLLGGLAASTVLLVWRTRRAREELAGPHGARSPADTTGAPVLSHPGTAPPPAPTRAVTGSCGDRP